MKEEIKFQLAQEDKIFSNKSKKLKKDNANKPYWDNTHPIENNVEQEIKLNHEPKNGYKLLHQIYGNNNNAAHILKSKKLGGKRTAKEIKLFIDASYQKKPPQQIDNWILDEKLSKATGVVYHNPETN